MAYVNQKELERVPCNSARLTVADKCRSYVADLKGNRARLKLESLPATYFRHPLFSEDSDGKALYTMKSWLEPPGTSKHSFEVLHIG